MLNIRLSSQKASYGSRKCIELGQPGTGSRAARSGVSSALGIEMAVVMVTSNQVGGLSKSGNGAFSFVKVVFCCDVHNAALPSRRCRCAPLYYAQAHDRLWRMRWVKRRTLDGSHCYLGYQESVEERQSFKLSVDDGQFVWCIILLKMSNPQSSSISGNVFD